MDLPIVLSIINSTIFLTGAIFAGVQLRHLYKQRERENALQMVHSFQTPEFITAVNIVFYLNEGLSKKEIEDQLGDKISSILVMFGTFESLGILVYKHDMDIQLVEDFFSGIIILSGRKLKNYLTEIRDASNRQTYYEWYQWLYEQFEKRESQTPAIPAFIAFRDWKE